MLKIGSIEINGFPLLLAPMEDVSDPPFRVVCKANGADLMYSEFISVDGLIRDAVKSQKKLEFSEQERPLGIQIFGAEEEPMRIATDIVNDIKPDLLDINFGCPVKKVVCKNSGAAILKDIPKMVSLAKTIVGASQVPVTVKTRLGWDEESICIEEVAERLQDVGIVALTVHGRTRKQMYKGEADWTHIAKIKENPRIKIPIIGNGDITSPQKAMEYKSRYGVDGIMIGRAAIGNPWIFNEIKHFVNTGELLPPPSLDTRIQTIKQHLLKSIEWKGERLGILEMRRHYSNYLKGLPHIKPTRTALVTIDNLAELLATLDTIPHIYAEYLLDYHQDINVGSINLSEE